MAKQKVATPYLSAFLDQAHAPDSKGIIPEWAAAAVGGLWLPLLFLKIENLWLVVFLLSGSMVLAVHSLREKQIRALPAAERFRFRLFADIKKLKTWKQNEELQKSMPAPVLESLERVALAWHDARQDYATLLIADPALAETFENEIESVLVGAIHSIAPLIYKEGAEKKDMKAIADNAELIDSACSRLEKYREMLKAYHPEEGSSSIRENLLKSIEQSKQERAQAEAELDGF